jgi:predicted kinase
MPHVHLVIGPVGAGKSTLVRALCREHRAVALILDDWMARLFGADERPPEGVLEWYVERRDRCIEQIWAVAQSMLAVGVGVGVDVVLEIGLIQRSDRAAFYSRLDAAECGLTIHVVDATRELRRERVRRRNLERGETFAMVVPPHIFELASDMWQPPEADECRGRDVRFLPTAG